MCVFLGIHWRLTMSSWLKVIEAEWRIYASLNCVINGSDNGLSPVRRQALIWINAGILFIGPLGTNFSEISIEMQTFLFKKMCLNVSSAKWRPFCLGLNVLNMMAFFAIGSEAIQAGCWSAWWTTFSSPSAIRGGGLANDRRRLWLKRAATERNISIDGVQMAVCPMTQCHGETTPTCRCFPYVFGFGIVCSLTGHPWFSCRVFQRSERNMDTGNLQQSRP